MTKEDWQKVEQALTGTYGRATLMVDGRKVDFVRCLVRKNRLGIVTYIDGIMEGKWISFSKDEEYPEQRYLRPYSMYVNKPKQRIAIKKLAKTLGKKMMKEMDIDPDRKIHGHVFDWTSAAQIRRHYQKTFTSIELIEVIG